MASRADAVLVREPSADAVTSATPSLRGALRASVSDLYFHSWRLVPANIVWSAVAIAILVLAILSPIGLIAIALLAVPTAGMFRMTAEIARGEAVSFWDSIGAWRTGVWTTLTLGGALGLTAIILSVNLVTGILAQTMLGWAFATLAFWGLVGAWVLAWTIWPILADPWRSGWPVRERLRLAGYLVLAHPVRICALGLLLLVFLAASAIAIVAILTVSVAIAALVATRYILPAADRLDARLRFAELRGLPAAGSLAED